MVLSSSTMMRGAVLALTVIPVAQHLWPELAGAECNPNRSNNGVGYHAGWYRINSATNTVTAEVKVIDTWVYSGSRVSSWTMLVKADHSRWAQVGWREWSGNNRERFYQYTYNDGTLSTGTGPSDALNSSPAYKTEFVAAQGRYNFYVNGNLWTWSGTLNWVPGEAQNEAETHTKADQMPGTSSSKETMRNVLVKLGANWNDFNGTIIVEDSSIHSASKLNSEEADVWDKC